MKWKEEDNKLVKEFEFNDFVEAVTFVQAIVPFAEKMQHHPDIQIHRYNKVRISLTTHDVGEVTEKDHTLAKQIDALL